MQFLQESLVELITQTATNLPPDVREAMGIALAAETPHTQASQALGIIATNIDISNRLSSSPGSIDFPPRIHPVQPDHAPSWL